jgi:hypothetical protein
MIYPVAAAGQYHSAEVRDTRTLRRTGSVAGGCGRYGACAHGRQSDVLDLAADGLSALIIPDLSGAVV